MKIKTDFDGFDHNKIRPWSAEWKSLDADRRSRIKAYQTQAPVKISRICREFGLKVFRAPLPARISGEIRPDGNGSFEIKINRYESSNRQRFTAAHELSHYLLHEKHINSGIVDTVMYRSNLSNTLEAQANRLAADLLMPIHLLRDYLAIKVHGPLDAEALALMADEFQVSEIALEFRLGL